MPDTRSIVPAFSRASTKSALVAVFVGLSLATNYTLTGLPNIKLMDTFDFLSTYLFGLSVGLPTVIVTRTIYASVNPWGSAIDSPIIGALVLGDCLYALSGFVARKTRLLEKKGGLVERSLWLGLIGLLSALGFDLITNFATGLIAVSGPDLQTHIARALFWGLITMNFPLPMGIFHEASDFFFFSTVAPSAISLIRRSSLIGRGLFPQPVPPKGFGKG